MRENFPRGPLIFPDICQLHTGRCINVVTGLEADVPVVDIFIAGFVCTSVSSENNQRGTHGACIAHGTGKTGSTFEGLRRFAEKTRPKIVICENVTGLMKRICGGRPQIVDVGEAFQCLGYNFAYRLVDARMYLLPQRRHRVWIWAIRKDISAAPAASRVNDLLAKLEQPEPAPLSAFLEAKAGGHCPRQEPNAREAEAVNSVLTSKAGSKLSKAEMEDLVIDISKSSGRAPWCAGATPCVLPNSRLYWRHVRCVLGPREVAALQGIWPADFRALSAWCEDKHRSRVVADMAGNAFTSTVAMAVCFAVFVCISGWVKDSWGIAHGSSLSRASFWGLQQRIQGHLAYQVSGCSAAPAACARATLTSANMSGLSCGT